MRSVLFVVVILLGCSDGATARVTDEEDGAPDEVAVDTSTAEASFSETAVVTDSVVPMDVATETPSDASKACTDSGAKVFAGHCYFPTSPMAWADAVKACDKVSAHLVTITSDAEQIFVTSFGGITDRWIGLERKATDPLLKESYKWITGEAQSVDKWSLTEPNGSGTCGEMTPSGLWGDADGTKLFPGLCERD